MLQLAVRALETSHQNMIMDEEMSIGADSKPVIAVSITDENVSPNPNRAWAIIGE